MSAADAMPRRRFHRGRLAAVGLCTLIILVGTGSARSIGNSAAVCCQRASPVPGGPADAHTADVAAAPVRAAVSAVGDAARNADSAALRTAIREAVRAAGFDVLEETGEVLSSRLDPGHGLAIHAWEIESMARLTEREFTYPLALYADVLAQALALPELTPATILQAIRAGSESEHPAVRSWALAIAELSLDQEAIDILDEIPADSLELDAIQLTLLSRRLMGDLAAAVHGTAGLVSTAPIRVAWATPPHSAFMAGPASDALPANPFPAHARGAAPRFAGKCAPDETTEYVMDWHAVLASEGFGGLIGRAGGPKAERANDVANLALAAAQLIYTYAAVKATVAMEGAGPLVRTKETNRAGSRRTLIAEVIFDVDDMQWFSCARAVLNYFGLDFSLPEGGPMRDVDVSWSMHQGGVRGAARGLRHIDYGIVEWGQGTPPLNQRTDDAGQSSIDLVGKRQRDPVSEKAFPVMKEASGALKLRVTRNNLLKDLPGLTGVGFNAAAKKPPISGLTELVYRAYVPVRGWRVPVQDWTATPQAELQLQIEVHGKVPGKTHRHSLSATILMEGQTHGTPPRLLRYMAAVSECGRNLTCLGRAGAMLEEGYDPEKDPDRPLRWTPKVEAGRCFASGSAGVNEYESGHDGDECDPNVRFPFVISMRGGLKLEDSALKAFVDGGICHTSIEVEREPGRYVIELPRVPVPVYYVYHRMRERRYSRGSATVGGYPLRPFTIEDQSTPTERLRLSGREIIEREETTIIVNWTLEPLRGTDG
jgi:hypothetical protein